MTDQSTLEQTTPTADDLGKCVTGLVNAVARGTEEQLEPWGFSALEFSLLGVCYSAGTTTVTKLAEVIPIDSGRISRIVNRLHNRGLISRQRMASDRRVVKLQLSDDGRDLVPASGPTRRELQQDAANGYFCRRSGPVRRNLPQDHREPHPPPGRASRTSPIDQGGHGWSEARRRLLGRSTRPGRRRPTRCNQPVARRPARSLTTYRFPSGHRRPAY